MTTDRAESVDRQLGCYALSLRESEDGRWYVARAEWWSWGGRIVAMNGERVSRFYRTLDATRAFCKRYCEDNPGCKTGDQAQAIAEGVAA